IGMSIVVIRGDIMRVRSLETADPAFETVSCKSVLVGIVLPVLDLHVFDLVARHYVGQSEELLDGGMRQVGVIVEISPNPYGGVETSHLRHACPVFFRREFNAGADGVELGAINGDGTTIGRPCL